MDVKKPYSIGDVPKDIQESKNCQLWDNTVATSNPLSKNHKFIVKPGQAQYSRVI